MLGTIVVVGLATGLLVNSKSIYTAIVAKITGVPAVVAAKGSAFARLAEQDGKVIALKAASKVKAAEAAAIHAGLDEFDKMIG